MAKITKDNTKEINSLTTNMAVAIEKISNIEVKVSNIDSKLERDYVTKEAFTPVKNLVYGLVSLIMTMVVAALVYLVIKK